MLVRSFYHEMACHPERSVLQRSRRTCILECSPEHSQPRINATNFGLRTLSCGDSEESLNDVYHLIVSIQDRQGTPFVKGQARVADIEADHIADANIVSVTNL